MKAVETNVHKLLQGTKVFLVPNFQRRYAWRLDEWRDLWDDIDREAQEVGASGATAGEIDGHFLGSVVLHPAPGPASTVTRHLVIDGQQRLTTLVVILAALRDVRTEEEPDFDRGKYDNQYLTNPYDPKAPDRLIPTALDREAYTKTIRDGQPVGGIGQAYVWFKEQIRDWVAADPDTRTYDLIEQAVLLRMMFVEIATSKDDAINTIFNTLNSKGKPLSAADLIRNELLLYLSPEEADNAHAKYWLPVEKALISESRKKVDDSNLVGYFWARELAHTPNVPIKDLFSPFQRRLKNMLASAGGSTEVIRAEIAEIYADHDLYVAILDPDHCDRRASGIPEEARSQLRLLRAWGSAPHVPVSYSLLSAHAKGHLGDSDLVDNLYSLLSYLVRRTLAGYATNNLNRILSGFPEKARKAGSGIGTLLIDFLSRSGGHWPTDETILEQGSQNALFLNARRAQVHFILTSLEHALQGKEPVNTAKLTIEHVFPQKPEEPWFDDLAEWGQDPEEMRASLHTIGNLTLSGYNSEMSNKRFQAKRSFLEDSPLALNRRIVESETWTTGSILSRADRMLDTAVRLWRGPAPELSDTVQPGSDQLRSLDGLKDVLNSIPEGSWTTREALTEVMALDEKELAEDLAQVPPVLRKLVRETPGLTASELSAVAGRSDSDNQGSDLQEAGAEDASVGQ